jgi:hypothetical protein
MSMTKSKSLEARGSPSASREHAPSYLGTVKAFGKFLAKLVVRECAVGMRLFDTGDGKLSCGARQVEADGEPLLGPCLAQELEVSGVCLGRSVAHEGQFTTRQSGLPVLSALEHGDAREVGLAELVHAKAEECRSYG